MAYRRVDLSRRKRVGVRVGGGVSGSRHLVNERI